jgi:hypothetical protein
MRFSFFLLWVFPHQSHMVYKVVNQHTNAYCNKYKGDLKPGDTISQDDYVEFHDNKGIVCLVNDAGTYVIRPDAHHVPDPKNPSEFSYLVRRFIGFTRTNGIAAGRSGGFENIYQFEADMRKYASDSTALLVVDTLLLDLPFAINRDKPEEYFTLRYNNGEHPSEFPLNWVKLRGEWKLQIHRTKQIENEPIKVELWLRDATGRPKENIADFYLRTVVGQEVYSELKIIHQQLSQNPAFNEIAIRQAIYSYLRAYYGRPDHHDFENHILPAILK